MNGDIGSFFNNYFGSMIGAGLYNTLEKPVGDAINRVKGSVNEQNPSYAMKDSLEQTKTMMREQLALQQDMTRFSSVHAHASGSEQKKQGTAKEISGAMYRA